jgi:hypothetical protein
MLGRVREVLRVVGIACFAGALLAIAAIHVFRYRWRSARLARGDKPLVGFLDVMESFAGPDRSPLVDALRRRVVGAVLAFNLFVIAGVAVFALRDSL